ncbi:hypothetical protein HAX54_034164, partial [Datura stramonium]|nr:hypothetical protein [Datura stramonium]
STDDSIFRWYLIIHQLSNYWMWVGLLYQVIPIIFHKTNIGDAREYTLFAFFYMRICGSNVAKDVNLAPTHNFLNVWWWSFIGCDIFISSVLLLSVVLNETLQFLTKKGRTEEAKVALRRITRFEEDAKLQYLVHLIENEDREL